MSNFKGRLFVYLQHLLPRFGVTAMIYRLTRVQHTAIKNLLIRSFIRLFKVDTQELDTPVPDGYATFNDFFIRQLKADARPVSEDANVLTSPVDGTISEAGKISHGRLFQAKGHYYSLRDLLATDLEDASHYNDGKFATIYLAPHNYHRVHAPFAGHLTAARYVPGDLFSVNQATVSHLPGLFARNERLICHFDSELGPFVVIFVGAMNVGSISTPWSGEIRPRRKGMVEQLDLADSPLDRQVKKGDLLGWFNMGSTVILLLPRAVKLQDSLQPGKPMRMGEDLATISTGTL
ncbi:MAG: archaetidylserine decarboxylase [Woeseia sp.]